MTEEVLTYVFICQEMNCGATVNSYSSQDKCLLKTSAKNLFVKKPPLQQWVSCCHVKLPAPSCHSPTCHIVCTQTIQRGIFKFLIHEAVGFEQYYIFTAICFWHFLDIRYMEGILTVASYP